MITSKQNVLIKEIRSLADKKYRDSLNAYVVEGFKVVREVVGLGLPIKNIVATQKGADLLQTTLNTNLDDIVLVSDEVFKSISQEVTPQGVLAVMEKPTNNLVATNDCALLLDGVADPGNVGTIIRTAVASGYKDIYMTEECADAYSPKCVRASMSGVFRSNVMRGKVEDILNTISLPIVVADMNGVNVFTNRVQAPFCLVIGNEGRGVSQIVRERASVTVSIPMQNDMESLNAAVSAGILMYNLKNH